MNIAQIKKLLKYLPAKKSILLKGTHGIGKTEFVKSLAEELGLNLVIWHASHAADAGDITGLPMMAEVTCINPVTGESETHKVTKFAAPEWMRQSKPCLVLLDEINRGLSVALNAIMQFTNDGTYDSLSLPEGSRIIACINPDEDGKYDVGRMDDAQLDRFAVYDFNPTVDEWLDWMRLNKKNSIVIDFITQHRAHLDPYTNAQLVQSVVGKDCKKLPSRRTWTTVADVIDNGDVTGEWETPEGRDLLGEILAGLVGTGAAVDFMRFYNNSSSNLDPAKVLTAEEFSEDTKKKIRTLCKKDQPAAIAFTKACAIWMEDNLKLIDQTVADNLVNVYNSLTKDAAVCACTEVLLKAIVAQAPWAQAACKLAPAIKDVVRQAKLVKDV